MDITKLMLVKGIETNGVLKPVWLLDENDNLDNLIELVFNLKSKKLSKCVKSEVKETQFNVNEIVYYSSYNELGYKQISERLIKEINYTKPKTYIEKSVDGYCVINEYNTSYVLDNGVVTNFIYKNYGNNY